MYYGRELLFWQMEGTIQALHQIVLTPSADLTGTKKAFSENFFGYSIPQAF